MIKEITEIKDAAIEMGACNLIENVRGWRSLESMMMSSHGIEFVGKNHDDERLVALFVKHAERLRKMSVFVDTEEVRLSKTTRGVFFGKTNAQISCSGTEKIYTFVVLNGASASIDARNYAVVRLYNFGGDVSIRNDGTARILI